MELKRDVDNAQQPQLKNETDWDKLTIFEKYQFFTPGKQ